MGASRNVPGAFGRRRRLSAPKHGSGDAGERIDVQFSGLGVIRPDERKAFVNQGRLPSPIQPTSFEARFWTASQRGRNA